MGRCTDGIRVEKVTDGKISGSAPLVHSKTVEIDSNRPETFTSSSYSNATHWELLSKAVGPVDVDISRGLSVGT